MDDPMIRSRLGRINGTRPLGTLDPKRGSPSFFFDDESDSYQWNDFRFVTPWETIQRFGVGISTAFMSSRRAFAACSSRRLSSALSSLKSTGFEMHASQPARMIRS